MMKKLITGYYAVKLTCLVTVLLTVSEQSFGQLSPPGLDETNAAVWSAIGLSQKLSKRWSATMYVGGSRKSDPNDLSFTKKPAIFVVNAEASYHLYRKWSVSLCASHRIQNEYTDQSPYDRSIPGIKDEERFYMRVYFRDSVGTLPLVWSLRPELRSYHSADGDAWSPVNKELRFRLKMQTALRLNRSGSNQLILANEILTATDREIEMNSVHHWSAYHFTEDRFSIYLRHKFNKKITTDIGFMNQIKADGEYVLHLSADLIFSNLFSKK